MARDDGLKPLQTVGLLFWRYLIVHLSCRCSGACRIHERKCTGKADFIDEREGVAEIALRLAREADDEIGAEGEIGATGA